MNTEEFGQFVKFRRKQKGLTQIELAKVLSDKGDVMYISKLERGLLPNITLRTMNKLLIRLDAEIEFKGLD